MGRLKDPKIEELLHAAERGDIGAVLDFLESGYDVDAGDSINTTPLMRAVQGGHVELIRVLLDHGASLTPQNSLGHTAMTCALLRSRGEYRKDPRTDRGPLELLLAAGARYELREAVMLDDVGLARTRLDEGADVDTGEGTYHGPLLMIAAELGYLAIVDLLLERGANIEATDDLGQRPLLGAARYGRIEVVRHLLDRGAEIDGDDWSDQTALSEAAVHDHQGIVDLLLSRGAKRGLLDAVALDDVALAEQLIRDGADPNNLYYGNGRLVMYAVSRGNVSIVRLLMDSGAAHHHERFDKHPLLAEAAAQGHVDVVRLLIERGADLQTVGKDGKTALAWATERGHAAVADYLKQVGAVP